MNGPGLTHEFPPPGKTPREDTAAVMKFYKLPKAFPKPVLDEAASVGRIRPEDFEGRLDLRRKFIFTCDPETARDYDDALSLTTDRRGNRVLGVHIADVSRYVRPGGALDREAYRRSTSVYFCDRVVPMLPETLSNGVCSLMPGEDRLAFSVFITFDRNGEVTARSFSKSVIRSKARFTYEQVMTVIGGGRLDAGFASCAKEAARTIRAISALAQQLRARRFAAGALDLDVPEAEVLLDGEGEMSGIVTRPYDESHQMVEECMVAANEAVAKELWTHGVKILARLHEPPEQEKMLMLRAELRGLGVKVGDLSNPKVFAQFMKTVKSHPLYPTIATMVLRSMKRAVYDATSIGHFGLAKRYYAHFTSPIRRYPDLTLHRQLAAYLSSPASARVGSATLTRWATHASEREEIAAEAERGLLEIKKFRLLESQLQSRQVLDYDAVIARCMPFGCFVDIPELDVSGLVHVSLLSSRYVRFNESDQTLSAPGGGSWRIGDRLRVHVARVDFRQRRIDFVPVGKATPQRSRCKLQMKGQSQIDSER
ncbi:MAG: VacB/RNase II family 3'-5' exoribonuclease [Kiritimatiellae bacterium]|nr:VacB/RNase II family 3'-5' exoribonuclease [Kiritimatiellia bacterium]